MHIVEGSICGHVATLRLGSNGDEKIERFTPNPYKDESP
jgi:hypothetical protein